MKKIFTFLFIGLVVAQLSAHSLSPATNTFLFNHLADVNQQWLKQRDLPKAVFQKRTAFKNDIERIQQHLKLVEQVLRQRDIYHLNASQKNNRLKHLDVLQQYWNAAAFPTNTYHSHRQPYFVDNFGVHCAVGYLLHTDGQDDFVNMINTKDNYAYIHELTKYPQLENWATENGFTIDELAWIQPGYQPPHQDYDPLGNNGGADGDIFSMKVTPDSSMLILAGDFTIMDGITANGIIGWNGNNWQTFGSGVDGVIYDFAWRGNQTLVIVGNFKINNQQVNIARWEEATATWIPLQTGNMQGSIYTIYATWNDIYIGGDFQTVNGVAMPYLAKKQGGLAWNNNGGGFTGSAAKVFSVDAPVKCIRHVAGQLLIGGEFTQTAPNSSNPVEKLNCNYLAYWDGYGWTYGLNGPNSTVNTFLAHHGKLYVGGDLNDVYSLSTFELGVWNNYSYGFAPRGNGMVEDFFIYNNELFAIGDFFFSPFVGYYGRSIASFSSGGISLADSSITAAAVFQDKVFVAGRFSNIDGQALNQVASSSFDGSSSTVNVEDNIQAKVFYHQDRIIIEFENDYPATTFRLLDASGRVVKTYIIEERQRFEIPTYDLSTGVYFYQLQNEKGKQSGKLGVF